MKRPITSSTTRLTRVGAACTLALAVVATTASGAPAATTVTKHVSFDGPTAPAAFADASPLRERYAGRGIHFLGRNETDGGAILDEDDQWGVDPHSGQQFLAFDKEAVLANGGVPWGPETIGFDQKQHVVKIYVAQLGPTVGTANFTLVARRAGQIVDVATVETTTRDWSLLRVSAPGGIRKVTLRGSAPDDAWAADDLTIKRS